jgi:hypothetical protein
MDSRVAKRQQEMGRRTISESRDFLKKIAGPFVSLFLYRVGRNLALYQARGAQKD